MPQSQINDEPNLEFLIKNLLMIDIQLAGFKDSLAPGFLSLYKQAIENYRKSVSNLDSIKTYIVDQRPTSTPNFVF